MWVVVNILRNEKLFERKEKRMAEADRAHGGEGGVGDELLYGERHGRRDGLPDLVHPPLGIHHRLGLRALFPLCGGGLNSV